MKRAVIYLFFDTSGFVDDYVLYNLAELKKNADYVMVVSNSAIQPHGRAAMESIVDEVWQRENTGFDVWAYKTAMEHIGRERLATFDELILMNYTFFGPIFPYEEMFARMDARDVDFWGVTEHKEIRPHPTLAAPLMHAHIQSHWIAVRKNMLTSPDFAEYWDTMPMIESYHDSINIHESRFTKFFADRGWGYELAFPAADYPSDHPIFDNAALLLRDRCPILKRRIFFHDPLYLDRKAIIGRDILQLVEDAGYPLDFIWTNVARTAEPRVVATNMTLNEVMPRFAAPEAENLAASLKVAMIAHCFYPDMVDELLQKALCVPGGCDVYLTTSDETKKQQLEAALKDYPGKTEVRIVESNKGRDISAFLITCADVIRDGGYDLIMKLHSKKSPQDDFNAADLFKRHLFDNLAGSPGYTANVIALFAQHRTLGMVFPPVIHLGYPTLGHSWFANKVPAQKMAKRLGITVPFDKDTPLSPYGSMFIARPQALVRLVNAGLSFDDFPDEGGYQDGSLAHVIERLFAYVGLQDGWHTRTVMTCDWAATNYSFLEYKYQAVSRFLPAFALEQGPYLQARLGALPNLLGVIKTNLMVKHPGVGKSLKPLYRAFRGIYRRARRLGR
ncbi:MAG: rhamnan synthesis F family protein [Actinomycetaceae bacterium]|nr:rhamnan synthesis F family protein [Actinomycetaceae bacterium]